MRMVSVGRQQLASYRESAGDAAVDVLYELAASLRGVRVLHLSATPYGGGCRGVVAFTGPLAARPWSGRGLEADGRGRRVLRGHQGDTQRSAGRRGHDHRRAMGHVPFGLGTQRATARSRLRRDRRARSATRGDRPARRPRHVVVGLAVPHRHLGAEPGGLAAACPVPRGLRRRGVHARRIRPARLPGRARRDHPAGN